jgi:hypothetical protein
VEAVPEDLDSGLLVDETGEHRPLSPGAPGAPQPISSTSLVDDPPSSPGFIVPEEPPPLAPLVPLPSYSAPASAPAPPAPATLVGTYAAVSADALPDPVAVGAPAALDGGGEAASSPSAMGAPAGEPLIPQSQVPTAPMQPPRRLVPPSPYVTLPPPPRPPWLVPALTIGGAAALALALGGVAYLIKSLRGPSSDALATVAPSASAASSAPPVSSSTPWTTAGTNTPAPQLGKPGAPCVLAGAPHIVAPRALLRTGIETSRSGDRIALGVALGDKEGFVVTLDPATFVALQSTRARSSDALRRVIPVLPSGTSAGAEVTPFLETNRRHVDFEAARPVEGDPPFVVGVADGKLVWGPTRASAPIPLWTLETDLIVDAIRVVPLGQPAGYAVAFRQGTSIFLGALKADKTPMGDLTRIGGLGPQIGAPAMAAGKDHVVLAWSDRPATNAPWQIRWLSWRPGTEVGPALPFLVPPGGAGGQAMSPSLLSLAGGSFVMAWTEGLGNRHEVRAQAIDATDQPVGTALTVSAEGVNAGQGIPALTPDGRGAVVFLATPTRDTASVVAVPVVCPGG